MNFLEIQCLFKSIRLCWGSFLQADFAYEMMLLTEDVIFFHTMRMIHNHIFALIRNYFS